MVRNPTPKRSKITVRVWTPIFEALVSRTDAAFLRRDQLISHALRVELPRIRADIPHRNSAKARRYIEARLQALFASGSGATQFSLALEPAVAKDLEALCQDLNIPRESLLNRLFMLLGASGQFLADHFIFFLTPEQLSDADPVEDESVDEKAQENPSMPLVTKTWRRGDSFDVRSLTLELTRVDPGSADYDKALAPLGRIESVVEDPLRWYRCMLHWTFMQQPGYFPEESLQMVTSTLEKDRWMYTPFGMPFERWDEELEGLNCYTPDAWLEQDASFLLAVKPDRLVDPVFTVPVKLAKQRRAK